ncbi:hypothetical protein [Cellulomonas cellasea]|uniref:Uncharacterized protein n=2 Tax=Cellulomonas cellasea TaxID=43670 RepID=A0A0A0B9Q0_9CELL|nr:hypothetical protein [Cellulomonas cellasea]KGM02877.1 hypothetical protein Q760_10980 [Cellulomonas cellasea DSM 20118]GEA87162.1 hypothetical protein CCE01nite_11110 [Cellulomonas cellasea]
MTTKPESSLDDGRPGDDPDQTQWHFGMRFFMFWLMPLFLFGGAFVWWPMVQDLAAGIYPDSAKGFLLVLAYPAAVVGWPCMLVAYRRAKRRGETPVPGAYKPRRPTPRR